MSKPMPSSPYADLEIRIQAKTNHGYPIELTLGGHQRYRGGFLPADILPWVPGGSLEADGQRLFEILFSDDALSRAWTGIRGQHPQRRIRLSIDDRASELHTVPWELLFDAQVGGATYPLAASRATPFSRYPASILPVSAPAISERSIRIALAVAAPGNLDDYNLDPINFQAEQQLIETALKGLAAELYIIPQPCTLSAIEQAIKDGCHILHFVGHSLVSTRLSQAQLCLADENNRVSRTTAVDITTMISRNLVDRGFDTAIKLVFLSSGDSASQSQRDGFSGLALQLIQAGISSVLTMGDKVGSETARHFSSSFYQTLLVTGAVDVACNAARAALMTQKLPDHHLPVLYSRLTDGQLMADDYFSSSDNRTLTDGKRSVIDSDSGVDILSNHPNINDERQTLIQITETADRIDSGQNISATKPAYEQRRLEAAMPRYAKVQQQTEIRVMIALAQSQGLKLHLPDYTGVGDIISKDDVAENPVPLNFAVDSGGYLIPLQLFLSVRAPDFNVIDGFKKIRILAGQDSGIITFSLIPHRVNSRARITIELFEDEQLSLVLGSISLSTEIKASGSLFVEAMWSIVTLPLMAILNSTSSTLPSRANYSSDSDSARHVASSEAEGDIITGDDNQTGGARIGEVAGDISGQVAGHDIVNDNRRDNRNFGDIGNQTIIERLNVYVEGHGNATNDSSEALSSREPAWYSDSVTERPSIWNVPFEFNHNFTGRKAFLDTLAKHLYSQHNAAITQPHIIHGLGGVGKTQIALRYAYDHRDQYELVWWLRAEESNTLAADFAALASALGLPQDPRHDQAAAVQAVKDWLGDNNHWLLIFDNAPDQTSVQPYLVQSGHTLITSRHDLWNNVAALALDIMTAVEAVTFLVTVTGQADDVATSRLAETLGYLPLALAQAAAYIKRHGRSYQAYLMLFEIHRIDLLARDFDERAYPATVATTWSLSFKQIQAQNRHAFDLLYLLAYFVPDDIEVGFLSQVAEELPEDLGGLVSSELDLDETLRLLQQYALIDRAEDQITIHRLVQMVVQDQLEAVDPELDLETIAKVLYQISRHLNDRVAYARAQAYAERDLALAERVLGEGHKHTAASLNNLGELLKSQGLYDQARPLYERSLAIYEKLLGSEHPYSAASLNNLGELLQYLGVYDEAKTRYEQALTITKALFGLDHPETATCLNNLAGLLLRQGHIFKAKKLYEQALEIREKVLGPEHPHVAHSLNNLAYVLFSFRSYEEAKVLYKRALFICETVHGLEHPDTATSVNNLALLLDRQKEFGEAKKLYERALVIRKRVLGPSHPSTLNCLNNLAGLQFRLGAFDEAMAQYKQVLVIREDTLGYNHPDTVTTLVGLAELHKYQRSYNEAQMLYKRALEIYEGALGPEHPDTVNIALARAHVLMKQENYAEARKLFQQVVALYEKVLGPEHPDTQSVRDNLAALND